MKKYIVVGVLVLAGGGFWYQQHVSTQGPRRAAADLEGAATAGMSFVDFGHKLQDFSGAIAFAEQEGAIEYSLRPYKEAFLMYLESQALWKLKIDCPVAFEIGGHDQAGVMDPFSCAGGVQVAAIGALATKYGVPYDGVTAEIWRSTWEIDGKTGFRSDESRQDNLRRKIQMANVVVFTPLLSAIWSKAAQKARS